MPTLISFEGSDLSVAARDAVWEEYKKDGKLPKHIFVLPGATHKNYVEVPVAVNGRTNIYRIPIKETCLASGLAALFTFWWVIQRKSGKD